MDEHDKKAHRQQRAGEPDPADAEARREQCAEPRAGGEHADHAEVRQRLVQHLAVMRVEVDAQRLRAAAHVADAHGAGIGMAAHLAEGLYLHGADEGHNGVCGRIDRLRQKAHGEEKHNLREEDKLTPVDALHVLEAAVDAFGDEDPQHEREQRDEIVQAPVPVALEETGAEEHDVARLGVGEYAAAAEVGIGVLQAAGEDDEGGHQQRFGHLPAGFVQQHGKAPFS